MNGAPHSRLMPLVLLLLLHFGLRAHHLTLQDPYVDEGFHAARAAIVWDFDQHPARFGHGKLLLYFWLGIFEAHGLTFLYTIRTSIALFSLISAAAVYGAGRLLRDHRTGVLALGLYAVLPLAVFFERMAMADPFAAGFVGLAAWRSLVFARRPSWREGLLVGLLLGLATLAKLTMGFIPLLPVAAAGLYWRWDWENLPESFWAWLRRYAPPLVLAVGVVIIMWLPIVIPAYLARNSDEPFVVVNSYNLEKGSDNAAPIYIRKIIPEITDFTGTALPITLGAALLVLLWVKRREAAVFRPVLWLLIWAGLIALLPIVAARLISSRYFMPLAAPLALLAAYLMALAWQVAAKWTVIRAGLVIGLGVWLLGFAFPFVWDDLTRPNQLPLHNTNYTEYISGVLTGERAARQAGAFVNRIDPSVPVYITWTACHLMFFSLEREATCLSLDTPLADLRAGLYENLGFGEDAYIVISGYKEPFFERIQNLDSEQAAYFEREGRYRRPYTIWRLFWRTA